MDSLPAFCLAQATDRQVDFTLQGTTSSSATGPHPLRQNAVLVASTAASEHGSLMRRFISMVRGRASPDRVVWRVAADDASMSWEFYLYDPSDLVEVADGCQAMVGWDLDVARVHRGGFQPISFEIDDAVLSGASTVSVLNGYLNAGPNMAVSYELGDDSVSLRSFYRRFHRRDTHQIRKAIGNMVHIDSLECVLECQPEHFVEVHVAQKSSCDGIYWSGVPAPELLSIVRRRSPADPLRVAFERVYPGIDHLRFDLGVDFRSELDRPTTAVRMSIYGLL